LNRLNGAVFVILFVGLVPWVRGEESYQLEQDGRTIKELEWVSPHGELPGTYEDYIKWHPVQHGEFSDTRTFYPGNDSEANTFNSFHSLAILVDAGLYSSIVSELDEYVLDLVSEGYSVHVETVFGGTPDEIKNWVKLRHLAGNSGFIFVGDITAAWAEVVDAVFTCDLFYMDLDGHWEDADQDGDYEIHSAGSGDEGPEVYVARIYAHTLNYDTEPALVNGYFEKVHSYRQGTLYQPWRGLEYVEEDWHDMEVNLDLIYGDERVRHDFGYLTTAADYLNQMDLGQHFVQVCVHSYSGGHAFSTHPTESAVYAHIYVKSSIARPAKLLLGSDDGIKVWLNGTNVCTEDVTQTWQADQFDVDVNLNQGWNRLLCKISQGGGGYMFSARITDPAYQLIDDLEYQVDNPVSGAEEAQYIRGWLLHGFHQDDSSGFYTYLTTNYLGIDEGSINPQQGDWMALKQWQDHSSSSSFVDLNSYYSSVNYGVCYAFSRITADTTTPCELWLGYDDGLRIWLNGQEILNDNRYGSYECDMTKVTVTLNEGENRLLMKVSEWTGAFGFSARFAQSDGSSVQGLTYDPVAGGISYNGTWLLNGPYANDDPLTRLSLDYLGNEQNIMPSEGDSAPFGVWDKAVGSGFPFDFGDYYDETGWVLSQDIQDRDPPVIFYNLFACGPGLFTDANYLAGSYIFNTTYGLITLASSKSGSMLNFHDFTEPLGQGKTIGTSFLEWFDRQAPYAEWEREWYYGMILNGDPTLRPMLKGDMDHDYDIDLEDFYNFRDCYNGVYLKDLAQGCQTGDFDNDGDVDCDDWQAFKAAWTGPPDNPPFFDLCDQSIPTLQIWTIILILIILSIFIILRVIKHGPEPDYGTGQGLGEQP